MLLLKAIPHPRRMKMIIITDGLVIKETSTKENDKVITILTRDRG
ncbi:MAG: recombination protein O N-terminal domain-containing protein, partial [Clostridia bacterium]|nr:recombination protein O N-terminal domain-containing protein [Clostridia bacterium]